MAPTCPQERKRLVSTPAMKIDNFRDEGEWEVTVEHLRSRNGLLHMLEDRRELWCAASEFDGLRARLGEWRASRAPV